ncbi:hypothetical protein EDD16DRAFT_1597223 [Pisolithus croceorrhizus]|nr:hypothetical protein EDD16DRAFT_1597223 [Pisolithus croceorrhizus]
MAPHRTQRRSSCRRNGPRPLTKLESIVLPRSASHHARIWAELAYTVDEKLGNTTGTTITVEQPVEISFREFMDRLNGRSVSTGLGKRKTEHKIARQLLQDAADNGHLELHYHDGPPPRQIHTIVVLPAARDKLTGFLPRMRGFDNLPERVIYQGTLALAKRNFFPDGCRQPTKEQFAERNIEKYIRLQSFARKPLTRTLTTQDITQVNSFTSSPESVVVETQGMGSLPTDDVQQSMDVGSKEVLETDNTNEREVNDELHACASAVEPVTPRALQPMNWVRSTISGVVNLWYATPESLPRRTTEIVPETPSTPSPPSRVEDVVDSGSSLDTSTIPGQDEETSEVGALFQQTATFEWGLARLDCLYKVAIEASAFAKAKAWAEGKLAKAERDLDSLRADLANSNLRVLEIARERDDKANEIERLYAEITKMGKRMQVLEDTLRSVIGAAQAGLNGSE